MEEGKQTLTELVAGTIVCACLFLIPGLFFAGNRFAYFIGLIEGAAVAVWMAYHMYRTLNRSLDLPEGKAAGYIRKTSLLRLLIMAVMLGINGAVGSWVSVLGLMLGIMCLKFSAYLQPLTHKMFYKFINKGR